MPDKIYPVPDSTEEVQRLNDQALLFESALDYMVHPDIAARLPSSPRVADIGTNSGDYLVRLSSSFPADAQFDGFDISSGSFYSEGKLPANVKLHVHDIRTPFPDEFHGQFDYVHLRLLVGGLRKEDWAICVGNIMPLLRPGGAIQWVENDITGSRVIRGGKAGSPVESLNRVTSVFLGIFRERLMYGFRELPDLLREAGLQNVFQDIVSNDRVLENREKQGTQIIAAMLHWAATLTREQKLNYWSGELPEDIAVKAADEVDKGAYLRYDIFATIGFKAE